MVSQNDKPYRCPVRHYQYTEKREGHVCAYACMRVSVFTWVYRGHAYRKREGLVEGERDDDREKARERNSATQHNKYDRKM